MNRCLVATKNVDALRLAPGLRTKAFIFERNHPLGKGLVLDQRKIALRKTAGEAFVREVKAIAIAVRTKASAAT
jgi:hypothetical protein